MKIVWTVLSLNALSCWAQSSIQEHHPTIQPAAVNQHNYASTGHLNQKAKNLQNHPETNQPTTHRTDGARSLHFFSGTNHQNSIDVVHQPSRSYLPASKDSSPSTPNYDFNQHHVTHLSSSPNHEIYQSKQQSSGYHSKTAFTENKYSQSKFSNTGVQQPTDIPSYVQSNRLANPTPDTGSHNQLLSHSQQSINSLNNLNGYSVSDQQSNSVTRNSYNTNGFNIQKNQASQFLGGISGSQEYQRGSAIGHKPYTGFQTSHQPFGVNESSGSSEYQFSYGVAAQESGTEFEHQEARNGDQAKGKYSVLLPDGRRQLVEYEADEYGFRPKVSYVGRSFSDPLSQDNFNTVVSDLLNTDLKRSRGQKASSAHQGRYDLGNQGGINTFGDVNTRFQQDQHFQTNRPAFRQVSPSLSNFYPTNTVQSPSGRSLDGFSALNSNQISSNTFSTEPYGTSSGTSNNFLSYTDSPNQITYPTTSFRPSSTSTQGSFVLRPQNNYPSFTTPLNQPTNGNQYNNYNHQPNTSNKSGSESHGRSRYVYAHSPGIIYSQSYANNRQDASVQPQTINSS